MKTVLIIEDNTVIRENVCEMLELGGYQAIFAVNGKVGLDLAKELRPDIILCDIIMPGANGFEVFGELKADADTSEIPFVFITASVGKKEIEKGLAMGAKGYIQKPFTGEELFETLEGCFAVK
jgi:CheY-like chemotaxis protein